MPDVPRVTLVGYGLLALVVVVIGVRWMGSRPASQPAGQPATAETSSRRTAGAGGVASGGDGLMVSRAPSSETVHVTGAVRRPGVYRFGADARVRDAVRRAGGPRAGGDTAAVNLAAKLTDGQQVVVPARRAVACAPGGAGSGPAATSPGSAAASGAPPSGAPVSLGSATLEQLDTLPGVGPSTAQKILEWRTQNGGFASVDDLAQVPGIGPKKLEALRTQVQP